MVELAPDQLVDPLARALARARLGVQRLERGVHAGRGPRSRRSAGTARAARCRRRRAGRDRARSGRAGRRRKRSSRRAAASSPAAGSSAGRRSRHRKTTHRGTRSPRAARAGGGSRSGPARSGRLGVPALPPRIAERRVDPERGAAAGAHFAALEDHAILVLLDDDTERVDGATHRGVAAARVGPVVAVPGDARRSSRSRTSAGISSSGIATLHHQSLPARFERGARGARVSPSRNRSRGAPSAAPPSRRSSRTKSSTSSRALPRPRRRARCCRAGADRCETSGARARIGEAEAVIADTAEHLIPSLSI